jgi:hypothetical protein
VTLDKVGAVTFLALAFTVRCDLAVHNAKNEGCKDHEQRDGDK